MLYYIVMDIMLKGGVVFSMLDVTRRCGGNPAKKVAYSLHDAL